MSFKEQIAHLQQKNNSLLCVGLDTSSEYLISKIIEETHDLVCCYKINLAFTLGFCSEVLGTALWDASIYDVPVILDGKFGDIENTNKEYASFALDSGNGAQAVTLNPYMGLTSLQPFFDYKDRHSFILTKTSNISNDNIQNKLQKGGMYLYEHVMQDINKLPDNVGAVAGATDLMALTCAKFYMPDRLLLVPGVGAQGGSLEQIMRITKGENVLINVSRSVLESDNPRKYVQELNEKISRLI